MVFKFHSKLDSMFIFVITDWLFTTAIYKTLAFDQITLLLVSLYIKIVARHENKFLLGFITSTKTVNISMVLKMFYRFNFGLTLIHPNAEEQFRF